MARVLIVDDDRENIDLLTEYLANEGHTFQSATDAEGVLHRVKAWQPHIILLDLNLAGFSSLELIPKIRAASVDDYVSIVIVSASITTEDVARGLNAGADDYLTKPFRAQELLSRTRVMLRFKEAQDAVRKTMHRIDELTTVDGVTGLLGFSTFYRKLEDEFSRAKRFRKPFSLLAVDLDQFSKVNLDEGIVFGNSALREAAKRIKDCLRTIDSAGRLGGDQFLVMLVDTDFASAQYVGERICDSIRSEPFKVGKQTAQLTASIGIGGLNYSQPQAEVQDLVRGALEALYSAKAGGRNRVEIHSFA